MKYICFLKGNNKTKITMTIKLRAIKARLLKHCGLFDLFLLVSVLSLLFAPKNATTVNMCKNFFYGKPFSGCHNSLNSNTSCKLTHAPQHLHPHHTSLPQRTYIPISNPLPKIWDGGGGAYSHIYATGYRGMCSVKGIFFKQFRKSEKN